MRMFLAATMVAAVMSMGTTAWGTGSVADFDDLSLAPESYWNGADSSGDFSSGAASFNNNYDTTWGSWDGFAYSNLSQQTPPLTGWTDAQYTAVPGSGQASANYAIGYVGWTELPTMTLDQPVSLAGAYFTNNNWAYYSMLSGDSAPAKKFGGDTGNDPDWFLLTIEGFDSQDILTDTVEFYLADYRFADNSLDYIVAGWTWVDLSSLGEVKQVKFSLNSSDVGDWGMNTPAYFAMDTVVTAPEPTTCLLLGLGAVVLLCRKRS
ncbi:MAG: DUF4465 domain-containing protein [Actinobacteria bacterium]|nr:DUF4465 domain-containing protein [Actinomycetota bacterium]